MAASSLLLGHGSNASKFTITDNEILVDRPGDSEYALQHSSPNPDLLNLPQRNGPSSALSSAMSYGPESITTTNSKSLSSPRRNAPLLSPSSTSRAPFPTLTLPPRPHSRTLSCSRHMMVILFSSSPSLLVLIPTGLTPRRRLKVIINPKSGPVGSKTGLPGPHHLIHHDAPGERRAILPQEDRAYLPRRALPC